MSIRITQTVSEMWPHKSFSFYLPYLSFHRFLSLLYLSPSLVTLSLSPSFSPSLSPPLFLSLSSPHTCAITFSWEMIRYHSVVFDFAWYAQDGQQRTRPSWSHSAMLNFVILYRVNYVLCICGAWLRAYQLHLSRLHMSANHVLNRSTDWDTD